MAKKGKGMWCGFKQPFLWGERCVTSKRRLRRRLSDIMIVSNLNSKIKLFADGAVMYREILSSQDKVIFQNYIDFNITDQNLANEP